MASSGFSRPRRADQLTESQPDTRQMTDHFRDPHHREIFRADDFPQPRRSQMRSRAAEKVGFRPAPAQFRQQQRRVIIARSFSG